MVRYSLYRFFIDLFFLDDTVDKVAEKQQVPTIHQTLTKLGHLLLSIIIIIFIFISFPEKHSIIVIGYSVVEIAIKIVFYLYNK